MTTDTTTPELTDAEILEQIRHYVWLRNELVERGDALLKLIDAGKFLSRNLVIGIEDSFYEISRTYSPTAAELPIRVTPVTLLK